MRFFLAALLSLLLTGCAGYRIGPVQPSFMEGIRSIAVPNFTNENILEPRLEVLLANAVIKQLQQDGTYKVESSEKADAVLEGQITQVTRRAARSLRGNVLATRRSAGPAKRLGLNQLFRRLRSSTG